MAWAIEVSNFTVLYDACVLYPAPLRDLLMHVAVTDLYRAKWTDAIHDEWTRNVLKDRPDLKPEQLQRTRELMNSHVRDCLVLAMRRSSMPSRCQTLTIDMFWLPQFALVLTSS